MLELLQHGIAGTVQHDLVASHHHDAGGQGQQGRLVGHDHQGLACLCLLRQHGQTTLLLLFVHGGRWLIEQKDMGVTKDQAGECHQLFLPAAEAFAALGNDPCQALGVTGHESVHARQAHGGQQGFIARVRQANEQVVTQRAVKQAVVLLQVADVLVDHLAVDVAKLQPIDQDAPLRRVVQTAQHAQQAGLARANRAQHHHAFAGFDLEPGDDQGGWVVGIGEGHIGQFEMPHERSRGQGRVNAVVVGLELVKPLQPFECGLGMCVLHQQTRDRQNGRQNATTEDGAGNQGALRHVALHHHQGAHHDQAGIADLLDGCRQITDAFGGTTGFQVVGDGLGIDTDPAREELPAPRAGLDGFDALDRFNQ